ncbi:actin cytoskeleton-regulatory complex protein PAN1-like [Pyrus ussuriensis x Pyrus communis]|uniref:Actin cytoskeleton-regulatory complex protein PAN1-like n=1 Tax=Pyrus ussuriensis x Pyrus communis TaxID=2448454 RepID=A0A5N5HJ54_9ROSA|nr:actin cytoskeleton-regulatory complex protein PAN1-like [Pyrus ussuriensis x Pyrus communis]
MACTIDFRRLDEGFGGKTYKRKRNPQASDEDASVFGGAAMEIDDSYPPPAKRSAVAKCGTLVKEQIVAINTATLAAAVSTSRPASEAASVVAFVASVATWLREMIFFG